MPELCPDCEAEIAKGGKPAVRYINYEACCTSRFAVGTDAALAAVDATAAAVALATAVGKQVLHCENMRIRHDLVRTQHPVGCRHLR